MVKLAFLEIFFMVVSTSRRLSPEIMEFSNSLSQYTPDAIVVAEAG